jgi:hypothetical protein
MKKQKNIRAAASSSEGSRDDSDDFGYSSPDEFRKRFGTGHHYEQPVIKEANFYGFEQLRIQGEVTRIPPCDRSLPIFQEPVLNLPPDMPIYGEVTSYLVIDSEFDEQVPCKLTIVNERGQIVIDTLVKPSIRILNRQVHMHGITENMLINAPTLP